MKNKIEIGKEIVKGMSEESKIYWLSVLVANNDLTEAEAGFILTIK